MATRGGCRRRGAYRRVRRDRETRTNVPVHTVLLEALAADEGEARQPFGPTVVMALVGRELPPMFTIDGISSVVVAVRQPRPDDALSGRWALVLPPALARARDVRRATFLAGRYCASRALRAAGAPENSVVAVDSSRAPVWPAGFTGSITHAEGLAAAAAARSGTVVGVGIDIERLLDPRAADELQQSVAPEWPKVNIWPPPTESSRRVALLTAVFSAKESIYKCLHPVALEFFEFHDVSVQHIDVAGSKMVVALNRAIGVFPRGWQTTVHFVFAGEHVHTCAVLYACDRPPEPRQCAAHDERSA